MTCFDCKLTSQLGAGRQHWYCRGQGFKSCTSLNFFQAFFSQLQKFRIYNCDDHPSFNRFMIVIDMYCCITFPLYMCRFTCLHFLDFSLSFTPHERKKNGKQPGVFQLFLSSHRSTFSNSSSSWNLRATDRPGF